MVAIGGVCVPISYTSMVRGLRFSQSRLVLAYMLELCVGFSVHLGSVIDSSQETTSNVLVDFACSKS